MLFQLMLAYVLGNKSTRLSKKSSDIVNVFTETITKLQELNKEIVKEKEVKLQEVEEIQTQISTLEKTLAQNEKMASKITSFITN